MTPDVPSPYAITGH